MNGPAVAPRVREIWARTTLHVWPESYLLVSVPVARLAEAAALLTERATGFGALVLERDEVSITIVRSAWREDAAVPEGRVAGPFRVVTFDIDLDHDLCGFLAPAAVRLADAGVSIVPQCAFLKDHLLVHEHQFATAIGVLNEWIGSCRDG